MCFEVWLRLLYIENNDTLNLIYLTVSINWEWVENFSENLPSGGTSNECNNYHKHLAAKIAQKHTQRYEDVIAYIMCKVFFMILKSALLCVRGSRKANTDCVVEVELLNNAAALRY